MASRATVATVAIFDVPAFRPERKNLLVGEPPQTRLRANLARNVSVALLLIFTPPNAPVPSSCPAPHSPADNQCLPSLP